MITIPSDISQGTVSIVTFYHRAYYQNRVAWINNRADLMALTLETDDISGTPFVMDKTITQEEHFAAHNNHLILMEIDQFRCGVDLPTFTSIHEDGRLVSSTLTGCVDVNRNIWMAKLRNAMPASVRTKSQQSRRHHPILAFVGWSGQGSANRSYQVERGPESTGRHILWEYTGFRLNSLGLIVVLVVTIVVRTLITCFLNYDIEDELLVAVNQMYPGMCAVNKFRTWISGGQLYASYWRSGPYTVHAGFCYPPAQVDLAPEDVIGIQSQQTQEKATKAAEAFWAT